MRKVHAVLSSALIALPLTMFAGTAQAGGKGAVEVSYTFNIGSSNFTNCPPVATEVTCMGTGVRVTRIASEVGDAEHRDVSIDVNVFAIHLHPNGGFEIGVLLNSGSGSGRTEFDGVRSATIKGSVPMGDGSTAVVRFSLAGTGAISPYSGTATVDEAGCPSGTADINYRGRTRDALATGQVTIGGVVQVPTVAAGPAFLQSERDDGACTPM
jgi:hypothetical protein